MKAHAQRVFPFWESTQTETAVTSTGPYSAHQWNLPVFVVVGGGGEQLPERFPLELFGDSSSQPELPLAV